MIAEDELFVAISLPVKIGLEKGLYRFPERFR